jgi:hypothetical protein
MKHGERVSRVVSHLVYCKRQRLDFDYAWRLAMNAYPPAGGVGDVTTLFDERSRPHDPADDFLRRVCRNAYDESVGPVGEGNGPSVKYFRPDMIRDLDSSVPARRSTLSRGRVRQAA